MLIARSTLGCVLLAVAALAATAQTREQIPNYDYLLGRARKNDIRKYIQFGTAVRWVSHNAEKNTFNVLKLDSRAIEATHYMYFDDAGGFVPTSRHTFFRRGRPSGSPLQGR